MITNNYIDARNKIIDATQLDYFLCQTIRRFHPLGNALIAMPIDKALAKKREITNTKAPEEAVERLEHIIKNMQIETKAGELLAVAKCFGAGGIIIGGCGEPHEPLDLMNIDDSIWLNVLTPLEMVGSIRANQNPNASNYFEPNSIIRCRGVAYHSSRCITVVNPFEPVLSLNYSTPSFGFAPQSSYERPLKYLQEFLQNDLAVGKANEKIALMVHKKNNNGGLLISNQSQSILGMIAQKINAMRTGQTVVINTDEAIETVDLQHLSQSMDTVRGIILDSIAMASSDGIPSTMLRNLMLGRGLSEGDNDKAKEEECLIKHQTALTPILATLDKIAMSVAWNNSAWFDSVIRVMPDYRKASMSFCVLEWMETSIFEFPELSPKTDLELIEESERKVGISQKLIELAQAIGVNPQALSDLLQTHVDNINELKITDNLFSADLSIPQEQLEFSPFGEEADGNENITV